MQVLLLRRNKKNVLLISIKQMKLIMTREEWIEEYRFVVISVFKAEDKLRPQLNEVLEKYKDDKEKAAEIYSRMIAEEIVSHTSDEELEQL